MKIYILAACASFWMSLLYQTIAFARYSVHPIVISSPDPFRYLASSQHIKTAMENTLRIRADDGNDLNFKEYYYQPSMAAAILFIVLFAISTTLHSYQMIRTRTWFMIPFVIGTTSKPEPLRPWYDL